MVFGRRPQSPFMNAPSMEDYNPSMESQIEGDATLTVDMGNDPVVTKQGRCGEKV